MPAAPSVATAWTFAAAIVGFSTVFPTALSMVVYGDGPPAAAPTPAPEPTGKKA